MRKVGLDELVATNEQQYIEKAVRLIEDDDYRNRFVDVLKGTDFRAKLCDGEDPQSFCKAVGYLIENHESLKHDVSREPIFIR